MDDIDKAKPSDSVIFPITDLPDIRRVRTSTRRLERKLVERPDDDQEPIAPDAEAPAPDEDEADFGFTRATPEEALEFLRESQRDERDKDEDELAEFLR